MSKTIALVYPKLGFDVQDVSMELPMGYLCIAAPLEARGDRVVILDQRTSADFQGDLKRIILEKPIFIGLSSMTGRQILHALAIARTIREAAPEIPIVFGGVHPTLMAEQTLATGAMDIIVRGEGEDTVPELADALASGRDLSEVPGLSFRKDGTVIHTPDRPLVNLNAQPDIPYHLVQVKRYLMGQIPGYRRSLDVYTSRGCPCACIYCYNQSFNKRRWRPISTDRIIKNILYLQDTYHIDSLFFNDDNMFVDMNRVYEICGALEKLPYILAWGSVGSRVDALAGCDFDRLERSGCKHLYIGIESGSEAILQRIKKGITIEQTRKVVEDLSRTNIVPHYNFMTGFPGETEADLEATLDFIDWIMDTHPAAYVSSLHIATPYPGTPYYDEARTYGWKPPATLEEWGDIYWERTEMPWMSLRLKKRLSNISIVSYFIDHKVADRLQGRPIFLAGVRFFGYLARLRWKRRWFTHCPEFQLLKRLNEWSILE